MLIVEIFKDKNVPIARNIETKNGPKTFFHIPAAVDTGGLYPVEFRFPVASESHIMAPGKYSLAECSFKVGQFGDLEIDRFNITLIPLPAQQHQKAG